MNLEYGLELASRGRRVAAFFINFMLLGMLMAVPLDFVRGSRLGWYATYLQFASWPIVFCIFPESPGMRFMSLQVRDLSYREIPIGKRFIRSSVFIGYFSAMILISLLPPPFARYVAAPLFSLFTVLLLANAATLLVNPEKLSLIDMKSGTRIVRVPKAIGMLKPY